MFIPQNDNTRQLSGAVELAAFRPGRSFDDEIARVEAMLRFRQRYLPGLGMAPASAFFHEVTSDAYEPRFERCEWLLIDTAERWPREEGVYALVTGSPSERFGETLDLYLLNHTGGGIRRTPIMRFGSEESRVVALPDVPALRIFGRVKSAFKRV